MPEQAFFAGGEPELRRIQTDNSFYRHGLSTSHCTELKRRFPDLGRVQELRGIHGGRVRAVPCFRQVMMLLFLSAYETTIPEVTRPQSMSGYEAPIPVSL